MLIIGHRGAPSITHENTIESFQTALNLNVDGIEFDVQLTNDHQSIIYHDFELIKNKKKLTINKLTYNDLQNLGLSYHIPTFEEVISICPNDKIINIEIKSNLINNQLIITNILNILNQYNLFQNVIISSFNPFVLMELNKHTNKVKIGQLWSGSNSQPWFVTYLSYYKLSPYSFHASIEYITPKMAQWVKKRGMKLFLYTVNTSQQLDKAYSVNADAIFSDYPNILDTNSV